MLAIALLATLAVVGCGGDSDAGSTEQAGVDPAKAVPARAALYAEATIRPGGVLGTDAKAALAKLLRTRQPELKIQRSFDDEQDKGDLRFEELKRWAGRRVAVFVGPRGFGRDEPGVGFVMPTDKSEQALRDVRRQAERDKDREATYRGVRYWVDEDREVSAVTDGWVLGGDLVEFKAAVDTIMGAPAMAEDDGLARTRDAVDAGNSVAFVSVDLSSIRGLLLKELSGQNTSEETQLFRSAFARLGTHLGVSMHGDASSIRATAALVGSKLEQPRRAPRGALAGLPAGGWLQMQLGDFAPDGGVEAQYRRYSAAGARNIAEALDQIRKESGVDVDQDLLSWMGNGSVIVSGSSISALGVAVNIESTNGAKSVAAVDKIASLLEAYDPEHKIAVTRTGLSGYDKALVLRTEGLTKPVYVAANADRLVVGVNRALLTKVADPAVRLGDTPQYAEAKRLLGSGVDPSLMLDLPAMLRLIEKEGDVTSDAGYREAKPYLDVFGLIAVGGEVTDGASKGIMAVALR